MSQWTHVAAIFRLNSLGGISDEEIIKVFGREVQYKNLYDYDKSSAEKTLPMGSEGTLEMSIWHNPDKSCVASTTVSVFGDLRDYGGSEDIEKLKKWFDEVCEKLWIRNAIMQIEDEYANGTEVYEYKEE